VELQGKVAIVTGGARGIGGAIAERLVLRGARVVIADLDGPAAEAVIARISSQVDGAAAAVVADVAATTGISRVIRAAEARFGPVDLYFANAGVVGEGGLGDSDAGWARVIDVNLLAHVRAAELLVPQWIERGSGYFVSTASAAGLLTQLGMAQYSATKHAAVAFAEWLSVTYGDRGISVSCICPMGVDTALLRAGVDAEDPMSSLAANAVVSAGAVLEPAEVAEVVVDALAHEPFLILPHEDVLRMLNNKARDYDGWLRAMRSYQARLLSASGNPKLG
jgi:NAD(P)-dependent dehydrogenase (short-subunit alcohol dehydrogenase family)